VITGLQLYDARRSIGLDQRVLARKASVPLSVVHRAESSPGEPLITITQLNALMQALRAAGASFPPSPPVAASDEDQP
jgi:predicted transcriptional regulator